MSGRTRLVLQHKIKRCICHEHKLLDLLVIAICTLLCGGEGFNDMEDFGDAKHDWFKTFLELPHGIPSHDTFSRVFQALDPACFLECFVRWTQSLRTAVNEEIVALDGKALHRALRAGASAPVLVSAWARENGLVPGQLQVSAKSNEITAVPELLRALDLAGCLVTLDAMGCQENIAKEIKEANAEYVLALKGNHATVHAEVKSYLDDAITRGAPELVRHATVEKDHGRQETRTYWQSAALDWFTDRAQWEGLHSVGVVEARRQVGSGPVTVERRYYLSSLDPRRGPLRAGGARALERGKPVPLALGHADGRRPQPGARGARGAKPGHPPMAGVESVEA